MAHIEDLIVSSLHVGDHTFTAEEIISVLSGTGGTRVGARTTQTVTYFSTTDTPTVYYTALATDGITMIQARTTASVTQIGTLPMWLKVQPVVGVTDFIAVWDEGDVNDYVAEWVVVDT